MDEGRVPVLARQAAVELALGGGVAPEVDSTRGRHSHQVGAQAAVQAARALVQPDVPASYNLFPKKKYPP